MSSNLIRCLDYVESVLNDPDIVNNHIPIKDVKWWCYPPKEN